MDFQTALAIALASIPTLVTILWSIWQHNKRVDDARELLRAEMKSNSSEVLVSIETVKQKIEIVSSKLTSLEEDVKRSLNGVENLNLSSKEYIRSITEHNVKLENLKSDLGANKKDSLEINQNITALSKIVGESEKIFNLSLSTLEKRLNEIERIYIERLKELIEQLKDKIDKQHP